MSPLDIAALLYMVGPWVISLGVGLLGVALMDLRNKGLHPWLRLPSLIGQGVLLVVQALLAFAMWMSMIWMLAAPVNGRCDLCGREATYAVIRYTVRHVYDAKGYVGSEKGYKVVSLSASPGTTVSEFCTDHRWAAYPSQIQSAAPFGVLLTAGMTSLVSAGLASSLWKALTSKVARPVS